MLTEIQSTEVVRRKFLKIVAVTAFGLPTIANGQLGERSSKKEESNMEISRVGSQPSGTASQEYFTGTVRVDPLFQAHAPARAMGVAVTFEPGARTAWHSHPLGQTLIVTGGCGRVQRCGGAIEELHPGDVVWFPAGEKHWHGASPKTAMTHIAIQEHVDGKTADWMEKVSDKQYLGQTSETPNQ